MEFLCVFLWIFDEFTKRARNFIIPDVEEIPLAAGEGERKIYIHECTHAVRNFAITALWLLGKLGRVTATTLEDKSFSLIVQRKGEEEFLEIRMKWKWVNVKT